MPTCQDQTNGINSTLLSAEQSAAHLNSFHEKCRWTRPTGNHQDSITINITINITIIIIITINIIISSSSSTINNSRIIIIALVLVLSVDCLWLCEFLSLCDELRVTTTE